jgi:hypothetical protein
VQQGAHYEAEALNTYLIMAGKPLYARLDELPGLMDEEGLKEGLRAVAIIPVIHQDRVIACINIASHQYEEVPATARGALAAQVGSAIARVRRRRPCAGPRIIEIRAAARLPNYNRPMSPWKPNFGSAGTWKIPALQRSQVSHPGGAHPGHHLHLRSRGLDILYISPQIRPCRFSPGNGGLMGELERQIHPDDRERVVAEITYSWKR